jgi:aspartate/glutamate racemase
VSQRTSALTEYLLREIDKLARAGAAFGLLASNTPHVVFAELQQQSELFLVARSRGSHFDRAGVLAGRVDSWSR